MGIREKAATWLRERKERAAERKAAQKVKPVHGAPMVWVVFLAVIAGATLIGSTWMLLVFIAGSVGHVDWAMDWRNGSDGERRFQWFAEAEIHLLVGIGLFLFCVGIACFNAVWLHVRHYLTGLFHRVVVCIGAAVALFMISGAVVVQQWGTEARERDEVVAAQSATVGAVTAADTLASAEAELNTMMNSRQGYIAQASSVGAEEWQRSYIAQAAPGDPNRERIIRALGAARRADTLRADIARLRAETRVARVEAVEATAVTVVAPTFMNQFAFVLEEIRKPFIAVLGELLAMTMFGVALAAWRSRQQTIEQSGWADEAHRIEDHSDVAKPEKAPYVMQTVVREENPETGEKRVLVTPKAHWRTLKKGVKQTVTVAPEMLPDEDGVFVDGGARAGTPKEARIDSLGQPLPPKAQSENREAVENNRDGLNDVDDVAVVHEPPPELTEEQLQLLAAYPVDEPAELPLQATDDLVETQPEPVDHAEDEEAVGEGDGQVEQDEPNHVELPDGEGIVLKEQRNEQANQLIDDGAKDEASEEGDNSLVTAHDAPEQHDNHVRARALISA